MLVGVSLSLSRTVSRPLFLSFFSLFLIHSYSFTCSFFSFCIFSLPAFRVSLCLCRALHETTINTISHRLFFSFFSDSGSLSLFFSFFSFPSLSLTFSLYLNLLHSLASLSAIPLPLDNTELPSLFVPTCRVGHRNCGDGWGIEGVEGGWWGWGSRRVQGQQDCTRQPIFASLAGPVLRLTHHRRSGRTPCAPGDGLEPKTRSAAEHRRSGARTHRTKHRASRLFEYLSISLSIGLSFTKTTTTTTTTTMTATNAA